MGVSNVYNGKSSIAAAAVVLAGGKSSRMGRAKALLVFDGEPLIVHVARALARVFDEVVIVAAPEQELPPVEGTLVRDEVAYQGPVGGIYYGLRAAGAEFCFVASCDAPFLNVALIAHLLAQIPDYDVVVPYWGDRYQPLHAAYRKSVLPLLKEQMERGALRPVYLFDRVRTRKIVAEEIQPFDPCGLSFFNINTPQDYQVAVKRWEEMKQERKER